MDFVWSSDSTGMTNPMTTTGDTIYSSSGSTPARLGIGTTGQVLTVSGGLPTWATPSTATTSWTLINAGGTALTGASTITISGLSGYNYLYLFVTGYTTATSAADIYLRFNSSNADYYRTGSWFGWGASNAVTGNANNTSNGGSPSIGHTSSAAGVGYGAALIYGANSSGVKPFICSGTGEGSGSEQWNSFGHWNNTSVISSIALVSNGGNFDGGTVYIYGAN